MYFIYFLLIKTLVNNIVVHIVSQPQYRDSYRIVTQVHGYTSTHQLSSANLTAKKQKMIIMPHLVQTDNQGTSPPCNYV